MNERDPVPAVPYVVTHVWFDKYGRRRETRVYKHEETVEFECDTIAEEFET